MESLKSLEGFETLVGSLSHITSLKRLTLHRVHTRNMLAIGFLGRLNQLHSSLTCLDLSVDFEGDCGDQLARLVGACRLLEHFLLSWCGHNDCGLQSLLFTLSTHPSITHLEIANPHSNTWSEENQLLVANILHHNTLLRSIELSHILQSPLAISRLSGGIQTNQSLRELTIHIHDKLSFTPFLQSLRENLGLQLSFIPTTEPRCWYTSIGLCRIVLCRHGVVDISVVIAKLPSLVNQGSMPNWYTPYSHHSYNKSIHNLMLTIVFTFRF